jgi:ABC-type multidrug transport system ATPase subunit
LSNFLEAADLSYRYPRAPARDADVLQNVRFTLARDESLGIVGRNGSGKSTLLKILATILRPTSGRLLFNGRPVERCLREYRDVVNYCGGAPLGFYPRLTAVENLRFFSGMKTGRPCTTQQIDALLREVGLDESRDMTYAKFSLGMRQRLHLASLMFEPAQIWIADEPTTGLDEEGKALLEKILGRNMTKSQILVSHDRDFLDRVTSRVLTLSQGRLTC